MVFLSGVSKNQPKKKKKSINYAYLLSFLKFISYRMLAIHSAPVFVFLRAIFKSCYLILANMDQEFFLIKLNLIALVFGWFCHKDVLSIGVAGISGWLRQVIRPLGNHMFLSRVLLSFLFECQGRAKGWKLGGRFKLFKKLQQIAIEA